LYGPARANGKAKFVYVFSQPPESVVHVDHAKGAPRLAFAVEE